MTYYLVNKPALLSSGDIISENIDDAKSDDKKPNEWPACQFCGKPSKNVMFAAYVCDSEVCINQAMDERGGPAGHKKDPKAWME